MRQIIRGALSVLAITLAVSHSAQTQQAADNAIATYDAILNTVAGLEVYNSLLERQIQGQQQELEELRSAINEVPDLERQIPPLLTRMVEGLEQFIAMDLPFLSEERAERLAEIQLLIERSDVNDAEKFRRVLEAWEIENEYGRTPAAYVGELQIDGASREVDFLRVGRVALLYQTTDEAALTGAYDVRTGTWVPLGSAHRNSVRQALRMARSQIAPDLVQLPITPPQ